MWQSLSGSFGERKPARAIIMHTSRGRRQRWVSPFCAPLQMEGRGVGKYGRGARGAHRAPRAPAGVADGNGQERRADSARGAAARPEAVAAAPQNRTKGIAFLCDFARALCAKPHKKRLLCDFGGLDGGAAIRASARLGYLIYSTVFRQNGMENRLFKVGEGSFCNRRIKINPFTGDVLEDLVFNRDVFNPEGLVKMDAEQAQYSVTKGERREPSEDGVRRAASRARKQVFELCACNDLDLFFTLTLNKEMIDRYDYKAAVRKFGQWADNQVRRRGLKYVAVPELHKDGAVHFHGLCNSAAVRLVDSGKKSKGQTVYNLPGWRLGFTSAISLYGERNAAAHYVAKYISKQHGTNGGTIGGRYFYHGGALMHAKCIYQHADFDALEGREYRLSGDQCAVNGEVLQAGLKCKYL